MVLTPRGLRNIIPNQFKMIFSVRNLFEQDYPPYTHIDRMIIGGVCPATPQTLTAGKQIGADYFLKRRELGIIDSGPGGAVTVVGAEYRIAQDTEISEHIALGRWADPEDLSGAAVFLASAGSDYITGQNIFVNGGWPNM